jgi:hypothetical protein
MAAKIGSAAEPIEICLALFRSDHGDPNRHAI